MKNDITFTVQKNQIVFGVHQNIRGVDIIFRSFIYIACEYENALTFEDRYRTDCIKLMAPEFIIFYNGEEGCPQEKILKLSDA